MTGMILPAVLNGGDGGDEEPDEELEDAEESQLGGAEANDQQA